MPTTHSIVPEEQGFVLSNMPPSRAQKRLALGIVLGLICALYLVLGPFGGIQLGAVHSFVAVYTTGMFVTPARYSKCPGFWQSRQFWQCE